MRKLTLCFVLFCGAALGQYMCPIEPMGAPPIPPLGYRDVIHRCVCDSSGSNCRWLWIGVNGRRDESGYPGGTNILDVLSGGAKRQAETRAIEAQTAKLKAETELIQQQTRASTGAVAKDPKTVRFRPKKAPKARKHPGHSRPGEVHN